MDNVRPLRFSNSKQLLSEITRIDIYQSMNTVSVVKLYTYAFIHYTPMRGH